MGQRDPNDFAKSILGISTMNRAFQNSIFAFAVLVGAALLSTASAQSPQAATQRKPYFPPEKVSVLPILHVPHGVAAPSDAVAKMVYRHVKWSQERYQQLLGTTFEIGSPNTLLFRGRYTLDQYKAFDNKVGSYIHAQHLEHLQVNRFNCPYVLFTVLYNPKDVFPFGRGGSMNGGFGTGGGTVLMSSFSITDKPNAQSTIQHELGHAFGLPHIDVYGYQLRGDSPSIMAYNPKHHTNFFKPSATPGVFIPEDLRGLALNQLAFPNLVFDSNKQIPHGYEIKGHVLSNSAAQYPESLDYAISVSTDAGEMLRTKAKNVVLGRIEPSPGPEIHFNTGSMWQSEVIKGEGNIDLTFPFPVELTSMRIYGGHSGRIHPVESVRILVPSKGNAFSEIASQKFESLDGHVKFAATESQSWRLALKPGSSGKICIRGIRFFSDQTEVFPPQICLVKP